MSREATIERTTSETAIRTRLNLDGTGAAKIGSGIPFFDHMLTLFARHGLFDLDLEAKGDIEVDFHHTVEDAGVDLSGRPYLAYRPPSAVEAIGGNFSFQLIEEFLRAFSVAGGLNLHVDILAGRDAHHMAEGVFKALARALDSATQIDPRVQGVPSTKGVL